MGSNRKKDARIRQLRRRGLELVSHDQFEKAAQVYEELVELEPKEGDWARRAADCHWQLKNHGQRLKFCILAAEAFCDSGFLLKGIAMCKVVLNLDPDHHQTQQRLARLYARRPGHSEETRQVPQLETVDIIVPPKDSGQKPVIRPTAAAVIDPKRQRARLAAAAALRQIRAQRKAQQHALFKSAPGEKDAAPHASTVAVSLATHPRPEAAPEQLTAQPDRNQNAPTPPPPAPDFTPPTKEPLPPLRRAPSLQALSLRAHMPSVRRSLTPQSPQPAYSLRVNEAPPPGLTEPLASTEELEALEAGAKDARRFSERISQLQMLEPSTGPLIPSTAPLEPSDLGADEEMAEAPLSLAPITSKPPVEPPSAPPVSLLLEDDEPASTVDETAVLAQFEDIPLFSALNHDTLVELINGLELVELEPQQILFDEGDLADSMFVVTEGRVAAEVAQDDGDNLVLAELQEGEFFGEIGLLSDQPRQARVRALTTTHLLRIERQVVARLMETDQNFLSVLIEFLRDRLVHNLVTTSPLFSSLPQEEGLSLAARFEFLELEENTALLQPGQRPAGLYVLLAGSALTYRPKGRPQLVNLGPGAVFGEVALLKGGVSEEEVRTTSKSFALCLAADRFRELIMTHPTVLEYVASLQNAVTPVPELDDHVTLY